MKLINILKRDFILPIFVTLIISIFISITTSLIFSNIFFREELQRKIRIIENKKVPQIIETMQELIYSKFQKIFSSLSIMNLLLLQIIKDYNLSNISFNKLNSFIKNHKDNLINAKDLYEKYSDILKYKDLPNKAVWYNNKTFTQNNLLNIYPNINNNDIDNITIDKYKLLYLSIYLIPIWKVIYEIFSENDSYCIDLIYLTNRKTETLITYPVLKENEYFYSLFQLKENDEFCLNNKMEHPDYFYFFCSDLYLQIQNSLKMDDSLKYFISYPYFLPSYKEKKLGITFCIINSEGKILFSSHNDYVNHEDDDNIYICIDFVLNNFYKIFDNFNRYINGYFYITKIDSNIPLYYPGFYKNSDLYFSDITRLEFGFNIKHTVKEVTRFNTNIIPFLTKKYLIEHIEIPNDNSRIEHFNKYQYYYSVNFDLLTNSDSISKNYTKGGNKFEYIIFPIFFRYYYENNNNNKEFEDIHYLSIIYTINTTFENNLYDLFSSNIFPITFEYGFIFLLIGIILITFCGQLILIFGKNITRPIQDIQMRIKEDSGKLNDEENKQIKKNNKNKKYLN